MDRRGVVRREFPCPGVHPLPGRGAGADAAVLTLTGDGTPLVVGLRATAFPLPSVTRLTATGRSLCFAPTSSNRVLVATSQPSRLRWAMLAQPHGAPIRCHGSVGAVQRAAVAGRTAAGGRAQTRSGRGRARRPFVATLALPLGGRRGLWAGTYRLTVTPTDAHGSGPPKTALLTVTR